MANVQRWRRSSGIIRMPVDSAEEIEVGDMMYQEVNDARNADSFSYVSANLDGTQMNFAAKFLGISMDRSDSGDTADIGIRNSGHFEMDCVAATFEVGDLVAPDDDATPDNLLDQQVIRIGEDDGGPIGRVVRRYGSNTTRVLIELMRPSFGPLIPIPLGQHTIGTADELLTNWPVLFPFKAVRLESIVATVTGAGAEVLTIDKNATALDDTMTIAATAPVGAIDSVALVDATGDDLFLVGDTVSIQGSGGTASGAVLLTLWVRPFNMMVS